MQTILIVDDEPDILTLLRHTLEVVGYTVLIASDGEDAIRLVDNCSPDLVLLDWMLPKVNGLDVCKYIKAAPKTVTISVIMISAKGDEFDKVLALEVGADDYVCKPFGVKEIVARVKAQLRRLPQLLGGLEASVRTTTSNEDVNLSTIDLCINNDQHMVWVKGVPVFLTKTEFNLLATLAKYPLKVLSRDQLLLYVWGNDFYGDNRVVDVHIRRLRSKLERLTVHQYVETVWGVGYKFVAVSQL